MSAVTLIRRELLPQLHICRVPEFLGSQGLLATDAERDRKTGRQDSQKLSARGQGRATAMEERARSEGLESIKVSLPRFAIQVEEPDCSAFLTKTLMFQNGI